MTNLEKKILLYMLCHELDISRRPFLKIAKALGMKEKDVVYALVKLQKKKIINKLRGVVNHIKAGYKKNALICWRIRKERVSAVTNLFIKNNLISHCCERKPQKKFNYNIFTMMHAKKRQDIKNFARGLAKAFTLDYVILFTEKELKKEKIGTPVLSLLDCQNLIRRPHALYPG